MSHVQLALNVDDLDEGIAFYSKFFNGAARKGAAGLCQLRGGRAGAEAGAASKSPVPAARSITSALRSRPLRRCRPRSPG